MEANGDGYDTEPGRDKRKVKMWRPIILLSTVRKLADKVMVGGLIEGKSVFHERAFTGRQGTGALDWVMLVDEFSRETGGDVYGRDIMSAFNSLERDIMTEGLQDHEESR